MKASSASRGRAPRSGRGIEPPREKGISVGLVFVILVFLAATGVFMLVMRQCTVRADVEMRKVESRIAEERSKQESLRLTLARLKSPGRVARIAGDELGLTDPSGVIYLRYARDASGNVSTQSTFEELPAPAIRAKHERGARVATGETSEEGTAERSGEETSGTGL